MLFKEIVDGRTVARTDDGRRTLKDHKSSLSTSCSGELIMTVMVVMMMMSLASKPYLASVFTSDLNLDHKT